MTVRIFIDGCLSCDILSGKLSSPGGVIYEDDYWHVDSVIGPVVWRGFLIVKLKRHCEQMAELSSAEALALGPIVRSACVALAEVIEPAKVYVCSFGDGIKHIHVWLLPRPQEMHPGMRSVMLNLSLRMWLTRFGIRKWLISDEDVAHMADLLRQRMSTLHSTEMLERDDL